VLYVPPREPDEKGGGGRKEADDERRTARLSLTGRREWKKWTPGRRMDTWNSQDLSLSLSRDEKEAGLARVEI
jgi:hypothetical protein